MNGKTVGSISKVEWTGTEPLENFTISAMDDAGVFKFNFKWFNNRWNLWVDLPDGTTRQAGVYPNVINWSGYLDYSLIFSTSLESIGFEQLFNTELLLVKWA